MRQGLIGYYLLNADRFADRGLKKFAPYRNVKKQLANRYGCADRRSGGTRFNFASSFYPAEQPAVLMLRTRQQLHF